MPDNLRVISSEQITGLISRLCKKANIYAGADICRALKKTKDTETSELAGFAIDILLDNIDTAKRENLPLCQDTGMVVVFADIGTDIHIDGDIEAAINEGVRQGYRESSFRNSIVIDPIDRINTGDNTPAVIHYSFIPDDNHLALTVAPKGFGSENMSAVAMLTPSDGLQGVEDFVVSAVKKAGANPCPPVIVGVGVGGTMEKAAILSKKALLRELGSSHPGPQWAESEARLLKRINALGIGASGCGGDITALGVHILTYPTHIAGLPVAVNIGCHATRHETAVI